VVALEVEGIGEIDFTDAATYYRVSTVNYLAAGSCNFNDAGVSLWPLDRIVADTQYYVRDAVIDYITAMGTVSPAIEGRLAFISDTTGPVITIDSPSATVYGHAAMLTIDFSVTDAPAGVRSVDAELDGVPVTDGQVVDLLALRLGDHTFIVDAVDRAGNSSSATITFQVEASVASLQDTVERFFLEGKINKPGVYASLVATLNPGLSRREQHHCGTEHAQAFIKVEAAVGQGIEPAAAAF
jgi:hypothetical protein